jgi:hypothetical protein
MAKEILEIQAFNRGTILNADSSDIPVESAAYSLNIDSNAEGGRLSGVPEDLNAFFLANLVTLVSSFESGDMATWTDRQKYVVRTNGKWQKVLLLPETG